MSAYFLLSGLYILPLQPSGNKAICHGVIMVNYFIMKRNITLLLLCIILCVGAATAQKSDRVLWGAKVNANIELPGKWRFDNGGSAKMYKPGFGVDLGAVCNIYLGAGFYFEPGIDLFYEGYRYDDIYINQGQKTNPKVTKFGMRLPLVAGYTFNLSDRMGLSIFAGPQLSYAFAGKVSVEGNLDLGEDFPNDDLFGRAGQNRFDCAWKVGVGFPVDSYMLSLEADFGLTDLEKGPVKFCENRVGLAFTYYF